MIMKYNEKKFRVSGGVFGISDEQLLHVSLDSFSIRGRRKQKREKTGYFSNVCML